MKVAIAGRYPRDPDRIEGGVDAVTLRLSRGLAELPDVDVHVVVSDPDREIGVHRNGTGVTVHSIGGARHFGNVMHSWPDRRRIAGALRALAPDVVHAHSAHREALGAIESGLPTVVTIHGILEREIALETHPAKRLRGVFRRGLVNRVLDRVRNVIVLSPEVRDHYRGRLANARVWMIENPVDDSFFADAGTPDPNLLLFSGFVIPRKGVRNLVRAFAIARRRAPDARLRVAGMDQPLWPEYLPEVRALAAELGVDDGIDFLGQVAPDVLAGEVARAAALVLVSRQETLPVAIQEAMAAGRPVIASPVGGIPHIVKDGENGYLVPHGDPEMLADRMLRVLEDPQAAGRLGAAARATAEEKFRAASVCRRTVDVYREVIARHAGAASPPTEEATG